MPNWCHNTLIVSGPADELAAFADKARPTADLMRRAYENEFEVWWPVDKPKPSLEQWFAEAYADQPLTFEGFAPQPADVDDWYSWRLEHWSTKWDASFDIPGVALGLESANVATSAASNGLTGTVDTFTYRFDTAWSPPVGAVAAMATQHPALEFSLRFGAVGGNFAGEVRFAGGEFQDEVALELADVLAPEQMWF